MVGVNKNANILRPLMAWGFGLAMSLCLGIGKEATAQKKINGFTKNKQATYNQDCASQDSFYAHYMAEATYAFLQNQDLERNIVFSRERNAVDDLRQEALCLNYKMGDFGNGKFKKQKTGGTVFDMNELYLAARKEHKPYIFLEDKKNPSITTLININALGDFLFYTETLAKKENIKSFPLKMVMCNGVNAHVRINPRGKPLAANLSFLLLNNYNERLAYTAMAHELEHVTLHGKQKTPESYNLRGHNRNKLSSTVEKSLIEERDCDRAAAVKEVYDEYDLACTAFCELARVFEKEEYDALKSMPKEQAIVFMRNKIFDHNKQEIENLQGHPPVLYRFVDRAETAKIDIRTIADKIAVKSGVKKQI